jgi:hypothetical protein
MKIKVLFLFVISLFTQVVMVSCCGPGNNGGTAYFAITGIDATAVYDFEFQVSISEGDSINSDSLLIKIDFYSESIASNISVSNFGLMQAVYACEEMPFILLLKSKIKSFTIKSDQPFGNHPAGFNLSEYADIAVVFIQNSEASLPIQAFVDNMNQSFGIATGATYMIYLKLKPENNLYHRFTIEIESEDGQKISSQTQQIKWG